MNATSHILTFGKQAARRDQGCSVPPAGRFSCAVRGVYLPYERAAYDLPALDGTGTTRGCRPGVFAGGHSTVPTSRARATGSIPVPGSFDTWRWSAWPAWPVSEVRLHHLLFLKYQKGKGATPAKRSPQTMRESGVTAGRDRHFGSYLSSQRQRGAVAGQPEKNR